MGVPICCPDPPPESAVSLLIGSRLGHSHTRIVVASFLPNIIPPDMGHTIIDHILARARFSIGFVFWDTHAKLIVPRKINIPPRTAESTSLPEVFHLRLDRSSCIFDTESRLSTTTVDNSSFDTRHTAIVPHAIAGLIFQPALLAKADEGPGLASRITITSALTSTPALPPADLENIIIPGMDDAVFQNATSATMVSLHRIGVCTPARQNQRHH